MTDELASKIFRRNVATFALALTALNRLAVAGPPYATDDPEPTARNHYEIYVFGDGASDRDGSKDAAGIDFNYGAAPDLQLTAVVPVNFDRPTGGTSTTRLGHIELAAKYRFLDQKDGGWSVAVFPRVFLPSGSPQDDGRHTSLLLPIWLERDWGRWTTFGGGGCELNRGGDSQDFCLVGWALTRNVFRDLTIGAELTHQTSDVHGGTAASGLGAGFRYDLNEHLQLLGSVGPGIQNVSDTYRYSWYAAILISY
jgi:hypothetical protein